MDKKELGKKGEKLAADYLRQKHYEILDKNLHTRVGEIDLIARDKTHDEIVFVEVKTRSSQVYGFPEESVTSKKLHKIMATAQCWMAEQEENRPWRIDIVAIEMIDGKIKIEHFENVSQDFLI